MKRRRLAFCILLAAAALASASIRLMATEPIGPDWRPIQPLEGTAWVDQQGMRVAWIKYKHCDDAMIDQLLDARVNTVFLKAAFHDILDMSTARREDDQIVVDPRDASLRIALEATRRATARGIHVFWLASYELDAMLPHLERLGYHHAYVEGPTRFVPPGPHKDAAALDPVFWKGIAGAYGDMVANHSLDYPIEGILFDTEHYAGGIMYLQGGGFADVSFAAYLESRAIDKSAAQIPAGSRYEYLKSNGLLLDFYHALEEQAYQQGHYLAERWRAVNPHLIAGTWPCFDNWFCQGMLRGMGGATRSLGLSGVEYFHGSEQTAAMADYFQQKSRNLKYSPGFLPPYSYTPEQLELHVARALRTTDSYWLLSPYDALKREDYRRALRSAYEQTTIPVAVDRPPIRLDYQVEQRPAGPVLIVVAESSTGGFESVPRLSLHAAWGGAPLCRDLAMTESGDGRYQAEVTLLRRLTNNDYLPDGFRSGANYSYRPAAHELFYEDPHHTKLVDGRAYGFFGTTVAWPPTVDDAEVVFDLHRPYRIVKVQLAQPAKLEDRSGGPAQMQFELAVDADRWEAGPPLESVFSVWSQDDEAPAPESPVNDPRHGRAWLSWEADVPASPARWLRLKLHRVRPRSSLSLGQVVITGLFDGQVSASIQDGDVQRVIEHGQRFDVPQQ